MPALLQPSAIGSSFTWLLCLFVITPVNVGFVYLFVLAVLYFLELQDASGSSCVFPLSVLELTTSPKVPWFCLLGNGIRNQDLGLGMLVASGMLFLLGPLSRFSKIKKYSLHSSMYICISINISVCNYLYLYSIYSIKLEVTKCLTVRNVWGFLGGSDGKESACNAGDPGLIPESGRSPRERNGTHSIILAWRIPGTEEPGKLQSKCLQL